MKHIIPLIPLILLIVLGCTENQVQQPPSIPSPPRELRALAAGDSVLELIWIDKARFEDGFELFQSAGADSPFVLTDTIPSDTAYWQLTGCDPTISYRYQLRSFNNIGHSAPSNTARVVDIKERFAVPNSPELATITGIAISPDGGKLAVCNSSGVEMWDIAAGTKSFTVNAGGVGAPSFNRDGTLLAVADAYLYPNGFSILNAATGEALRRLEVGDSEAVQACAFHPNGEYFVAGTVYWENGSYHARRRVWRTDDWVAARIDELFSSRSNTLYFYSLMFSPDGAYLVASFSNDTVMVYSGTDFHGIRTQVITQPWDIAFSPTGDEYCPTSGSGVVYLYGAQDGQPKDTLRFSASVISNAYSPDNQYLAVLRHDLSSPETRWLELVRPSPAGTIRSQRLNTNYAGRNFVRFAGDHLIVALQEAVTVYQFYR
jgi:WD40 repeat protein